MALVLCEQINPHTIQITLNDPTNLNALSEPMAAEFAAVVRKIQGPSTGVRAVVLTGSGKAFSSGGDFSMLECKRTIPPEENRKGMLAFYESFLSLCELPVPVIAMLNGHAIGAAMCIAAACDFRFASDRAKVGFTFSRLGLHPGMGATVLVPRLVGAAQASELLITGRVISAHEAQQIGLVNRVVPAGALREEVTKLVGEIVETGPQTVAALLKSLRVPALALKDALGREASEQALSYASAEYAEGLSAVREKRRACFSA